MKYRYNVYINYNEKLNDRPLSKEEVDSIFKKKFVYKVVNGINKKIYTKDLITKTCIVI